MHGLALARYFARFTVTSRLVAPTVSAIGDVAARAALYQHVYVLVERERIDAAYAACLALRRLEWSAVRHDVFALTTLSELFCLVRPHASVEMPLPTSRDAANIVIAKAKLEMLCSVTPRYYSDA